MDWKYVASPDLDAARLQLAGYRLAWDAMHPTEPIARCFVLHLPSKGGAYRLHDVTDDAAGQTFLAALVIYRERERRGRLEVA